MKCVAIGDMLLPAAVFDASIPGRSWVTAYESHDWYVTANITRDASRTVIRRMETLGSRAYLPTEEELAWVKDAEVLMTHMYCVPNEVFDAAPKLKYVVSCRGGLENIDLDAAREYGVTVLHCPAHNAYAVAEMAIALMMVESRNLARSHMGLVNGQWIERYPNSAAIPELRGSTVGIIGYGTIGRLVAERLKPFGADIIAHDPFVADEAIERDGLRAVDKATLLRESDFVTLHGRIGPNDPPVIGAAELRLMKPSAYLINTARAVLVDMDALYDALAERRIMGAALDVFPMEPLPKDYKVLSLDNVTLTNHRGGDTLNCFHKAPEMVAGYLEELLEKGTTRYMVR
ncbi:MAG: 2-hydroxyacid dehydrogenase [Clostridia bacterium]|nr:2-hydroxyacid dehydrogenase [Clostridia bacterium]